MEKSALGDGLRIGRWRPPPGQDLRYAKLLCLGRTHEILTPEQIEKGSLFTRDQRRCYIDQQIDFLPPQRRKGTLGHFEKENDRYPLGRRANTPAGKEP